MPESTQSQQKGESRFPNIPPLVRSILAGLLIACFATIEIIYDFLPLQILFYTLIGFYLLVLLIRAIRNRKTIQFQFELGTKQMLGGRFDEASERLRQQLDLLSSGHPIGFLHAFSRDFSKIDKAARSEPNLLDKIVGFAEYAFPFQNVIVAVATTSIKKLSANRFFRVSLSQADDGDFLFHGNSQNAQTPAIHVSQPSLKDCIDNAAGRMFYELNATDLTSSYQAYAHYIRALDIWSNVHSAKDSIDIDFEPAAECFQSALEADPNFVMASLYLAAMHSVRRSSTSYFERSRKRLKNVVDLCDSEATPGSKTQKMKIKGLAFALSCNLTNQWFHRIGKYENEDEAKIISRDNQSRARQAIELLEDSPLSVHEYAFTLHSMERIAFEKPHELAEDLRGYSRALNEYSRAMEIAEKLREFPAMRRSKGNRAYVMMWLGAMLRRNPDPTIFLRTLGPTAIPNSEATAQLWSLAETEMRSVAANAKSSFGGYSVANLCLLYSLEGEFGKFLHCARILSGLEEKISKNSLIDTAASSLADIGELQSKSMEYLEGANDIATGLIAGCATLQIPDELYDAWLKKGLEFHGRCLALIQESEAANVANMRIRLVKQMTNIIKLLHYADPNANGPAGFVCDNLRDSLNGEVLEIEASSSMVENWLQVLRSVLACGSR